MNNLCKKLALYTTIGTIGASSLIGCSSNDEDTKIEKTENSDVALKAIKDYAEEGEIREYEPYEHLFHIRYKVDKYTYGNSISIPDGYEVYIINNVIDKDGLASYNYGYDIWFTNKEKVRVKAVYNKKLDKYDFSNFGEIIEEKENNNNKTLQKNN